MKSLIKITLLNLLSRLSKKETSKEIIISRKVLTKEIILLFSITTIR